MSSETRKRQKLVICISGLTACGKSTVAKSLAKKYGLKYISGGEILKAMAAEEGFKVSGDGWWETEQGTRFLKERMEKPDFDRMVDARLLEAAKKGGVILDSWTMPWLFDGGFKIWLEASREMRAKRLSVRDGLSYDEALRILDRKDETTRRIYAKLYGFKLGFDLSPFDLILNVDNLSRDEVFHTLTQVIDRLLLGENVDDPLLIDEVISLRKRIPKKREEGENSCQS